MNNKLIKKLLNYWTNTRYLGKQEDLRLSLPGFQFSNHFNNICQIQDEESRKIIQILSKVIHKKANKESKFKWDIGWGQNYEDIVKNNSAEPFIVPYYFGKYPLSRLMGKFIKENHYKLPKQIEDITLPKWDIPPANRWESLEHNLVRLMIHNLIYIPILNKILQDKNKEINIYEFGAGTTHNLYFFKKFLDHYLPDKKVNYIALDWSNSTSLIVDYLDKSFEYKYIDYYKPDTYPDLQENGYIFSMASLEQITISSEFILKYIAKSNPKHVINIEPMHETLSSNSYIDEQSISYMKERNYLPDFLASILKIKMEINNTLEFNIYRSGIGSQFIDGYSVVEWFIK